MVTFFDYNQVFTIILFYTVVYNLALTLFFISITQVANQHLTSTFYLYNFPQGSLLNKGLMVALFSMAGVPPFIGFFSKLSVFVIILNSFFFILYLAFFVLLFSGLYFYLQNLRLILTSPTRSSIEVFYINDLNVKFSISTFILFYSLVIFILFGFFFLEDIFLYSSWLLA